MTPAAESSHRDARLSALAASGLLDSPPEEAFDRLTRLASELLHVPVALVSLVDRDRQFFKSQVGLTGQVAAKRETPLSHSFCQHVVASGAPLVVNDASRHELVADNAAVTDLGVMAYAGIPLKDGEGHYFGAMCAIDGRPREWSQSDLAVLETLAAQANVEISLRALAQKQRGQLEENSALPALTDAEFLPPLEALTISVQALDYLGPLTDAQRECLTFCRRDALTLRERLDALVDLGLLRQSGRLSLTRQDPTYLLSAAVERARIFAGQRNVALHADFEPNLPTVELDEERLGRVFALLLTVATALTHREGAVWVTARSLDDQLVVTILPGERAVSGPLPSAAGSQLGFALAESVTAAHGGRFDFLEHADGRREFRLALPAAA